MALAIKWIVHSACHVLGYPSNEKLADHDHGGVKSTTTSTTTTNTTVKLHAIDSAGGVMSLGDPQKKSADNNYYPSGFQMPLHYPRYKKSDYEKMEEWKVDMLLKEYGLAFRGNLHEKRAFAMGAFLWPDQY